MKPQHQPDQLHLFEVVGRKLLYDANSTKFFKIDILLEDILKLWNSESRRAIQNALRGTYREKDIERAFEEIEALRELGFLFSKGKKSASRSLPGKPRVVSLTLNVAAGCNLSCRYCWNFGGRYSGDSGALMNDETAREAVDLAVAHSLEDDEILVDFYGGEPLLNWDVVRQTIEYCTLIQIKGRRNFRYKITTNGTLLSDEIVDYLGGKPVELGVSIDGPREVHDVNRPFSSGEGSWDVIYSNVKRALDSGKVLLSARATLAPPHLDMVQTSDYLFGLGFTSVETQFADEPRGDSPLQEGFSTSEEDKERAKAEYLAFAHHYLEELLSKDKAIDVGLSNNITKVLYESPKTIPCGAGWNILAVAPTGEFYPCLGFVDIEDYQLGTAGKGLDIEKMRRVRKQFLGLIESCEACAGCWARYLCAGNCPANNVQSNNDLYKPNKNDCEDLKFQMETAMWLASELQEKDPALLEQFRPA